MLDIIHLDKKCEQWWEIKNEICWFFFFHLRLVVRGFVNVISKWLVCFTLLLPTPDPPPVQFWFMVPSLPALSPLLLLSLSTTDPHRQLQGKTYDWAKRIHFKLCMAWCVWRRGGGDEGWNLNETKPSHRYPFFCRGYLTSLLDTAVGFSKTTSSNECETCKGGHFNLSQKVLQYNPFTHHCLCRIALLNASIVLSFHLSYSLPPYTIPDHRCVYKPQLSWSIPTYSQANTSGQMQKVRLFNDKD